MWCSVLNGRNFLCVSKIVFADIYGPQKETTYVQYVPLMYFLLNGKTSDCYARALPRTVFVDCELAIHLAVQEVWHAALILGCRFHLGQDWFRKIQQYGLTKLYCSKGAAGSYLCSFFGLVFFTPRRCRGLLLERLHPHNEPLDAKVCDFTNYVYDTYISTTARFPPKIWSQYSPSVCRTTNTCERLHSRLNDMFYHAHPDFFCSLTHFLKFRRAVTRKCYRPT